MKRSVLPFLISVLFSTSSLFSQTLMDYVSAVKGDTLVVKDYSEMNNNPNALYYALLLDTLNVPAGRVYMLKANGYYPLTYNPVTPADRAITIVGEDNTILVNSKNPNSVPPVICGSDQCECSAPNTGAIGIRRSLTIKNCAIIPTVAYGYIGWTFFGMLDDNATLTMDNCFMEHTRWVFIYNAHAQYGKDAIKNCSVFLKNCYFVNMSGDYWRRYGGVLDIVNNQDTLLVENCTHIMAQGPLYNFRDYSFKRVIINHNTFINCSGVTFMNHHQNNMSVTNNLFINCNVQPYSGIKKIDVGLEDFDPQPMGLVNILPDSADTDQLKFYVDHNAVYWDSSLSDVVSTVNAGKVNGITNWQSQMIRMNARTQRMFDDYSKYPLLAEGAWHLEKPDFVDSKDLFTTQLANLKEFSIKTVDTNSTAVLPTWRLINTGKDDYIKPDWPIPVDLSYSNSVLLTGAAGSFPVGDLNWFPVKKINWNSVRMYEYILLDCLLNFGSGVCMLSVETGAGSINKFKLNQNYPNPFNPATKISFSIPESPFLKGAGGVLVSLKVYDILGREVTTLVNDYKQAGNYEVEFNASELPSGVYFYQIRFDDNITTKKMVLLK